MKISFVEPTLGGGKERRMLYDAEGFSVLLEEHISHELRPTDLSESKFDNMVNDFFFHAVWASKKILRAEFWTTKMCIDTY